MSEIAERIARAIDPEAWQYLGLDAPGMPERRQRSVGGAKRAIAALAKEGLVIHRFHDWKAQPGWPYDQAARVVCTRCGAFEDGLGAHVTSCPVPKVANVPD